MVANGLIISAPKSGSGKTLVTLALLRAFKNAGIKVTSAKVGPDYIDPGFHTLASGEECVNLDCWAMRPETMRFLISQLEHKAELILCEGTMGLFDGAKDGTGSTADLAAFTGWPVVLILDARAQAASIAALLSGFVNFREDVTVAGVVFNQVASDEHARLLRDATKAALPDLSIFGMLQRDLGLILPERHLGLIQANEQHNLDHFIDIASNAVKNSIDLSLLNQLALKAKKMPNSESLLQIPPIGQRIAIARDDVFSFCYSTVLAGWRISGAEICFFSPLANEAPDCHADAIYLPGGYPELHAGRLANNQIFLDQLRSAATRGLTIYGECGGYMVLGNSIIDEEKNSHRMAGLLPLTSSFAKRRLHLGYRRVTTLATSMLGSRDTRFLGHEFHYASITSEGPGQQFFEITDANNECQESVGLINGRVAGSFIHLIDRPS